MANPLLFLCWNVPVLSPQASSAYVHLLISSRPCGFNIFHILTTSKCLFVDSDSPLKFQTLISNCSFDIFTWYSNELLISSLNSFSLSPSHFNELQMYFFSCLCLKHQCPFYLFFPSHTSTANPSTIPVTSCLWNRFKTEPLLTTSPLSTLSKSLSSLTWIILTASKFVFLMVPLLPTMYSWHSSQSKHGDIVYKVNMQCKSCNFSVQNSLIVPHFIHSKTDSSPSFPVLIFYYSLH